MKNIKSIVIILLITSNAFFISAYTRQKDEVNVAKMIAEDSKIRAQEAAADARKAQQMAEQQAELARKAVEMSNEEVQSLHKQLVDCQQ